ncbi:MAG: PP2C family protein-serine/threonine phosphatase [Candidatus Krumholzibacteriia bacterium]
MNPDSPQTSSATGPRLVHASLSDIGCRREKNEDAVGIFTCEAAPGALLLVVADGVGGNAAGEVASRLAVKTFGDRFFAAGVPDDLRMALHQTLLEANRTILADAAANPLRANMATTCTAAVVRGQELVIGHIGDCRAYLAHDGQLFPLTEDHSLGGEYRRQGQALPPDKQSLSNVLTRWLGNEEGVEPDIGNPVVFAEGATLVLCSDGLTKVIHDPEILRIVSMHLPQRACQLLVERARKEGGPDNITVVVARQNRT